MTNNTHPHTLSVPMTRRAAREFREYANALAFVVESIVEDNAEDLLDITTLDPGSMAEWAEQYDTTESAIRLAASHVGIAARKLIPETE